MLPTALLSRTLEVILASHFFLSAVDFFFGTGFAGSVEARELLVTMVATHAIRVPLARLWSRQCLVF
jgi:hypothetical protein